jgi:site-specific recombinase XerD
MKLSKSTILNYKTDFRLVSGYREDSGGYFSVARTQQFVSQCSRRLKQQQISPKRHSEVRKAASLLCEMYQTGSLQSKRLPYANTKFLHKGYQDLLDAFTSGKEATLSRKTLSTYSLITKAFLMDMERHEYMDFENISCRDIGTALSRLSTSYRLSMASVMVALRSFFTFMRDKQLLQTDYTPALMLKSAERRYVIKGFSSGEMSRILNVVDRETAQGKRDYAILILGMHTGLRGTDVVNLTVDSIDWKRDELRIVQSKTKNPLELHLEPIVGNAIVDYLLHGRPAPVYESGFVFLSTRPPFNKLQGVGSINNFLYNYMDKAEVSHMSGERKGFHSFRRALATDLLEAGIETVVISNILGQANPNSVRSYLSLSQGKLKECALSLEGFALAREGLS